MIMRTVKAAFILALFMAALSGPAGATLINIGTATYGNNNYNLIYDDNPSGSIVWLDYSNPTETYPNQEAWASSLNGAIVTYNLLPGYNMNWSSGWQLPTTIDDWSSMNYPPSATSSQMAYLYYSQLGNTTSGLANTGPFANLLSDWYWSGTESILGPYFAWGFGTHDGAQDVAIQGDGGLAFAVRPGQLDEGAPVPEPSTILLLGVGLGVLAGVRLRRRGR